MAQDVNLIQKLSIQKPDPFRVKRHAMVQPLRATLKTTGTIRIAFKSDNVISKIPLQNS